MFYNTYQSHFCTRSDFSTCVFINTGFLCTQDAVFILEKSPLTATEGSCTEIKCSTVKRTTCRNSYWFWMKDAVYDEDKKDFNATVIFSTDNTSRPVSPDFASRVIDIHSLECKGTTFSSKWCSIRICNLTKTDSGNYSVRYVSPALKWKTTEVNLKVKGKCKDQNTERYFQKIQSNKMTSANTER